MEIYLEFEKWLDNLLENNKMPEEAIAFCFNFYDEEDESYGIQLIASDEFDAEDGGEWACSEVWSSEEEYLENGKYKDILLEAKAVAMGFVDGDLEILCSEEEE